MSARGVRPPMPMCGACLRPLGLFYAECRVCLTAAGLHGTYYEEWSQWQLAQRADLTEQADA